jgi:hypothetical protein
MSKYILISFVQAVRRYMAWGSFPACSSGAASLDIRPTTVTLSGSFADVTATQALKSYHV